MKVPLKRGRGVLAVCAGLLALAATPGIGGALTLEEAIALALTRNERARAADLTARASEARVSQARSFLLPDLTLLGDYTRRSHETTRTLDGETSVLQSRNGLEGRVTVEQTLFDAQAWPLLSQTRRTRDAARHDASQVKRGLAFDTAGAFLTVLSSEQVERAAEERLALARRNLEEARVRFGSQLVGSNDVTRAELEVASAERERVNARGASQVARLDLGYLLGAPPEDSLVVPEALLADAARPVAADPAAAPAAIAARPDVQAGRARLAALQAASREPLMRYLPDLALNGTAWSTNESGFGGRSEDWTVGLGLTWELFDGGLREGARSEASARAKAAALEQANLERGVAVDVEAARVALENAQASLVQAEAAVEAARRNAGESAELYRRGLVRAFEVVDANVQLFGAEVGRVSARYAMALSFLALRSALGELPLGGSAP